MYKKWSFLIISSRNSYKTRTRKSQEGGGKKFCLKKFLLVPPTHLKLANYNSFSTWTSTCIQLACICSIKISIVFQWHCLDRRQEKLWGKLQNYRIYAPMHCLCCFFSSPNARWFTASNCKLYLLYFSLSLSLSLSLFLSFLISWILEMYCLATTFILKGCCYYCYFPIECICFVSLKVYKDASNVNEWV